MAAFGAHIEEEPTTAPPSTESKTNDTPPATVVTPPTTDASEGKGGAGTGNAAPATTKQDPVQLTPLLQEQLKRSGVELPADVKDETLVDALRSVFAPKLHPDAVRLQQALDGGMKFEDYVQNYNALEQQIALTDNELVAQQLKAAYGRSDANPHGMEDAKITETVAKLDANGMLVIEAAKLRGELQKQVIARNAEREQYGKVTQVDYSDPALVTQFEQQVDAYVGEAAKGKQLFGQDLSKAEDQDRVRAILKTDLRVDPKERVSPFMKELRTGNNIATMNLLWRAHKSGQLEALMTKKTEEGKATLWSQLGLDPPKNSASPSSTAPVTDASAFLPPTYKG